MATAQVYVANLSATTTTESLERFMAFCGSIASIEIHEGGKATVVFEKPSAASTALMLNGGTLDGSPIQVSSEAIDEDTPSQVDHDEHADIPQEAKPRTAIVAEYLAHGYVLSDTIIQKAVAFDQKLGISSKFLSYFRQIADQAKSVEAQTGIQQKAGVAYGKADEKVKINEKASKAYGIGKNYYNRILHSEFGQQAMSFYTQTSNNIKTVHEEASRIAADKKAAATAQLTAAGAAPLQPTTTTIAEAEAAQAAEAAAPAPAVTEASVPPAVLPSTHTS